MLTAERKAALLAYCRIDELEPGEDILLEMFYDDAISYLADADVAEPPEGTPRRGKYDLVVSAMVLDSWDHRGAHIAEAKLVVNPAVQKRITQLKLTEPVPESGTGVSG